MGWSWQLIVGSIALAIVIWIPIWDYWFDKGEGDSQ